VGKEVRAKGWEERKWRRVEMGLGLEDPSGRGGMGYGVREKQLMAVGIGAGVGRIVMGEGRGKEVRLLVRGAGHVIMQVMSCDVM
jgi:hypothetical protein